ncbi:MAG: patatin-like phospholipase family protein [Mariprofundaceae bacterium]
MVRIGIVLSSGGLRGVYAHTGFLQAIERLQLPISAVAGCSAGAIVGGVYASGTPLSRWIAAMEKLEPANFWQPGSWRRAIWELLASRGRKFTGVSKTDAALKFCRSQLAVKNFSECPIPFRALATSLATGEKVLFSDGELAPRIAASSTIPLLYQPVEIDGTFYCDGGIIDLAPTDAICCKHHLDVLIVHHVASRKRGFHGVKPAEPHSWPMVEIMDTLLFRSRPWYLSDQALTFRRCPCGCGALIVVLEPDLPELPWPQTQQGPDVQSRARHQAEQLLKPHTQALCHDPKALEKLVLAPDQAPMEASSC